MATGKRAIYRELHGPLEWFCHQVFRALGDRAHEKTCFVRPREYGQVSAWRRASDFSGKSYTAMLTTEDHRYQQTE